MECRHAENLTDAYLDRELDESVAKELEAHLASCADCRTKYGPLLTLLSSPVPVETPSGLRKSIMAALPDQEHSHTTSENAGRPVRIAKWSLRLVRLGTAAACLLIFMLGWYFGRHSAKPPPRTVVVEHEQPPETRIVLSPWMLTGYAQAVTLRSPMAPLVGMVQAMAFAQAINASFDSMPRYELHRPLVLPPEPPANEPPIWPLFPLSPVHLL